ncbi:MAG TPA: glutathione-disulfide reductase [Pseudomonadales bacterium]|nr:glutathione-disulfide reductase [Pseudomonadales bacterium]
MQHDYDLVVIGAGSGGVRAARMSAAMGKRVAIIERQYLGGTCVNVGCIPKKLFHYAAQYPLHVHEARGFGWDFPEPSFSWNKLVNNVANEIQRLNGIYRNLLSNAGARLFEGEGRIVDAHTVAVGDQSLTTERILIAVGSAPWRPDIPGAEHAITSDDFFSLPKMPANVVVVGGGYIAAELAGILNGLGVNTTLLHRGEKILKNFDSDISQFLQQEIEKKGIKLILNENITAIEKTASDLTVHCASGLKIHTACVLYATGRKPVTYQLGLENVAVSIKTSGHIEVNTDYQTAESSIYAIGDAVGKKELTPVATAEAMWLVDHWFGDNSKPAIDYELIASCVFSTPEAATVGLTQQQAESRYGVADVVIFRTDFRPLKHTVSGANERVMMKLVVQKSTDKVLGLHMVGAEAGEIVQGFAVAVQMGVPKQQFDATIGIHPTAAEEFVTLRTPLAR